MPGVFWGMAGVEAPDKAPCPSQAAHSGAGLCPGPLTMAWREAGWLPSVIAEGRILATADRWGN